MKHLFTRPKLAMVAIFSCSLFLSCKHEKEEELIPEAQQQGNLQPQGHLTYNANSDSFIFRTNGGGTIEVRLNSSPPVRITHDDYPGFLLEAWGFDESDGGILYANHESLNGKHIKDRLGYVRTINFPDGAKLTLTAESEEGPLLWISIYDLDESHRIDAVRKDLVHSAVDSSIALEFDLEEIDGEGGGFRFTDIGLMFYNAYEEYEQGVIIENEYDLGEIEYAFPSLVRDYFDDPRLGHT